MSISKKRWLIEAVVGAVVLAGGYASPEKIQSVLYAVGGAIWGDVILRVIEEIIPWAFMRRAFWVLLVGAAFFAGWWFGRPHIQKYPREDGLIADFGGSSFKPTLPRNIFGEGFTVILDCENNGESKCWDEIGSENENKFLRVSYQLISRNNIPYAGVFTDFTRAPSRPLDVSRFSCIRLKLRMGQTLQESDVRIVVVLCTANVESYDEYAEYLIPEHDLKTTWTDVRVPFNETSCPRRRPVELKQTIELDPTQAFRIALVVKGKTGTESHGHFDVDDIRFSH
jgi:hypothetical protein